MTSLQDCLPPPGSFNWHHRRKTNSFDSSESTASIRHAIIREVWLEKRPRPHAVYKIEVMSNSSHWFVFRRYKEFYSLHQKLAKKFGIPKDFLPPKKFTNSMAIETLEARREALEHYLQRLINSCDREVSSWPDLLEFLDLRGHDVSLVATSLARHFAEHGERIVSNNELIMLTPVQLHCVTKQLQLPQPQKSSESVDLVYLYDSISRLTRLGITDYVSKATQGKEFEVNYTYDLGMFSKLQELQVDGCRISSIAGINSLPQKLKSLTIRYCLHTMKEFLIDCAAEKRPAPAVKEVRDSWRTHAAFRLSNKRVIVQPWLALTTINMSHNNIICLDSSITLLPAICELDLSHNKMAHLDLSLLEESPLQKLSLVNNEIYLISGSTKTLNNLKRLNLRQNRIQSMEGLLCAQGLTSLDLSHNLIVVLSEVRKLAALEKLIKLSVFGNPMAKRKRHRMMVFSSFMQRELELDGQPMTRKEKTKLEARLGADNEADFDDSMSISTVSSDDDLDSGIDGHVPSLEPLFEEEDYIVVDRDMNLDLSERCDDFDAALRSEGREQSVLNKDDHSLMSSKEGCLKPDRTGLQSFGSYRESYAANWKPGTSFGGARKRPTQDGGGRASIQCLDSSNKTQDRHGNRLDRTNDDTRVKDSSVGHDISCIDTSDHSRCASNASENVLKEDPTLISFDKLIRTNRSPKSRFMSKATRLFEHSSMESKEQRITQPSLDSDSTHKDKMSSMENTDYSDQACASHATDADDELKRGPVSAKYCDKDIVILPEIGELHVEDNDEDELWNGEDECEAGTECEDESEAWDRVR
eukprot:gene18188-20002_t